MGYNLGEYHLIGVVVKLENRLDINIIGVFKALLIRHYNCLLSRPVDSATKKKKTITIVFYENPRLDLVAEVKKTEEED